LPMSKAKKHKSASPADGAPAAALKSVTGSHLKSLIKGKQFASPDFDLRASVGTGTFSRVRVVKLKGSSDRTPMVLKIMKKCDIIQHKQVEHVKNERMILSIIEHPFIVILLATFQDDKRLFMLMEFVNGGELFGYLRTEGILSNDHAKFYAGEIILAYAYLHLINVVYRDLKPENLLIDCEGHIKLTDFGFAKVVEDRTYTLCGTPEYLAPEMIQAKGHGKPVDWWALGILIFEMLAGYPPFCGDSPFGTYQLVLQGKIEFPRHIDVKAKDLIKRLVVSDRSKRYGCLKNGAEDVKKHNWYKGMDWDRLLNKSVSPVPYVPAVKSIDDTSMFEKYPDSAEGPGPAVSAKEQELFEGFE